MKEGTGCRNSPATPPGGPDRDRAIRRRSVPLSGRRRAADLCRQLGAGPSIPLEPAPGGGPTWPGGLTGSISHTHAWAAAAVVRVGPVASVGIDVEPDGPLPPGLFQVVASVADRRRLGARPEGVVAWDRVLFSVKEAVYKAWSPLTHTWLDFVDVDVDLGTDGRWAAIARRDGLELACRGGWAQAAGFVAAAVLVKEDQVVRSVAPTP